MFPLTILKSFIDNESGAVTVDWVVLTGAIVGLGIYVTTVVGGSIQTLGQAIVDDLNNRNVGYVSP
jgi:Flp pilus assembly pilin Flp